MLRNLHILKATQKTNLPTKHILSSTRWVGLELAETKRKFKRRHRSNIEDIGIRLVIQVTPDYEISNRPLFR